MSVSCVAECIKFENHGDAVSLGYSLLSWFEFRNIESKEENHAWIELIMAIEVEERFSAKRIGLLVDSDLGNHDKYNAR